MTFPFMSFCTTANEGFPSRSAVRKGPGSALGCCCDLVGGRRLTKHFDEPFCGLEELERVDAVVLNGHVDERLSRRGGGQPRLESRLAGG